MAQVIGRLSWRGSQDAEGHREYRITHLVLADAVTEGPASVRTATGLAAVGSSWSYGSDSDPWAFCYPTKQISIHQEKRGEPNVYWKVEQTFSTKPLNRCQTTEIEDPLLEPQKVSGSFLSDTYETGQAYTDLAAAAAGGARDLWLATSSHEPLRGMNVDDNRPTVRIEQNVEILELALFSQMVNTVNDANLWGLPKRHIKLTSVSWERKLYGVCTFFYTRVFDFEVDFDDFDEVAPDYGTRCIRGEWSDEDPPTFIPDPSADKTNPQHFQRYKDAKGEIDRGFLDGDGEPVTARADADEIDVIYYKESNFLLLGIPEYF